LTWVGDLIYGPSRSMVIPTTFSGERDESVTLRLSQAIAAAPDLIWKALSSSQGLARWQADDASGEVREGGLVRLSWGAFGATVELRVTECVPHQVVRFRHRQSEVEFSLNHHQVAFTQYGLEPGEDLEGLRSSWTVSLAQLAHSVERHPGRRRSVEWLVRLTATTPETLHLYFTQPELLRSWLGDADAPLVSGETFSWRLHGGTHLTGRVLALVPGRDIALSCDNLGDGVIVLRSIPHPLDEAQRLVAISVSQWGRPARTGVRIIEQLEASLRRLASLSSQTGSA
jgi:uncharacterized protein YndB with AHSA1/START domain